MMSIIYSHNLKTKKAIGDSLYTDIFFSILLVKFVHKVE